MKKTYCNHTDACMDGVYCKAGHGGSYGYCHWFPYEQNKCPHYETDQKTPSEDILNKWKPGSFAFCVFGGQVYRATIRAVGFIQSEERTTWHVNYAIPIGTATIKINWQVGEPEYQLYKTRKEACMAYCEVEDDGTDD